MSSSRRALFWTARRAAPATFTRADPVTPPGAAATGPKSSPKSVPSTRRVSTAPQCFPVRSGRGARPVNSRRARAALARVLVRRRGSPAGRFPPPGPPRTAGAAGARHGFARSLGARGRTRPAPTTAARARRRGLARARDVLAHGCRTSTRRRAVQPLNWS